MATLENVVAPSLHSQQTNSIVYSDYTHHTIVVNDHAVHLQSWLVILER